MKIFNPTNEEYVPIVKLDTVGNTFNKFQEDHRKSIESASKLKQSIAQMDLNENEAEWKQSKINEVNTILANGTSNNSSAAALDDLVLNGTDILFGADMLGRLKRQQAWKANNDRIDKMKITEDYKRIFKQLNPYGQYTDRYDKDGRVIEGEAWKPTFNPVDTVPLNDILNTALKWAAKEAGSINSVMFLDANGNPTSDITKSVTGEMFSNTNGRWEKLSKDKLAQAVNAAINAIPGAKQSLEQDYLVAKWKFENGEQSDITDSSGIMMTPTEYIDSKVNPFYKAASYYNTISETKYGDAWKAQLAYISANAGGGTEDDSHTIDPLQARSNPITIKNTMPTEAQNSINKGRQNITDIFTKYGIKQDVTKLTDDEIKKYVEAAGMTSEEKLSIFQAIDDINDNSLYINSIKEGKTPEQQAKFDAYNLITSLGNTNINDGTDEFKSIMGNYNNIVNSIYKGGKAIRQYFSDEDTMQAFKLQLGGEDAAKDLGITFGMKDGKAYAELSKDNNKALYSFANAASKASKETHNIFGMGWQSFKNKLSSSWGDNLMTVSENGNESPVQGKSSKGDMLSYDNDAISAFSELNHFMKKLQSNHDDIITNSGKLTLSNNFITQATPDMAEYSAKMKNDVANASKYNSLYKMSKDEMMRAATNLDMIQHGGYIIGENNDFVKPTTAEALKITELLRNSDAKDIDAVGAQDPKTGEWGIQVTVKTDDGPILAFIPKLDNSTYERWNRDTAFKALNEVHKYHAGNRPLKIISNNIFNTGDDIVLVPNGNGFAVIVNGQAAGEMDKETAAHYRDRYHQFVGLKQRLAAGKPINPNSAADIINKTALDIAALYGDTSEEVVNNIKSRLLPE